MTILNDKDITIGGLTGIFMHTIMWMTRINLAELECIENCDSLMLFDIPISLFYFFGSNTLKIFFSLILGGLQWGVVAWAGIKFLKYLESQFSRKI